MLTAKRKVMVNNVPMSVVYDGMNAERFFKLRDLYGECVMWAITNDDIDDDVTEDEFDDIVNERFYNKCQRAATKAGWHASKKPIIKRKVKK